MEVTHGFIIFIGIAISVIGVAISGGIFLWKIQRAFTADISEFRKEIKGDISSLHNEVIVLGQRIAKIEGLLMPTPNIDQSSNIPITSK